MNRHAGISLILVAVLLIIVGTAVGTIIMREERENVWDPKTESLTDLQKLKSAIIAYERANHRLPCVAPRNALPGSGSYGVELADCTPSGPVVSGTARVAASGVRIGAIPHKTLGLPEVAGEDQWKNRVLYAVTESLTDPFQFSTASGTITVNNTGGAPISTKVAFIFVSHGTDGKGAYTGKGATVGKTCSFTAGLDQANCNDTDAVFVDSDMQTTAGAGYYDDLVAWDPVDNQAQASNQPCTVPTTGNAGWGTGCVNDSYTNMLNGDSGQNVSNTNGSTHTGNVTLGCDDGHLTYSGASCYRHCLASTQVWNSGNCGASVPHVNHAASSGTIPNTNPGFDGDATFSCNDGTLTLTGSTCTPSGPSGCAAQPVSWNSGNCNGNVGALGDGGNALVNNISGGYNGSVTVTCTGGVLNQSGGVCTSHTPDCYERGDPNCAVSGDACGIYHWTDTDETDMAPRDWSPGVPPPGWTFCPLGGASCTGGMTSWTVSGVTCTAIPMPGGTADGDIGTANDLYIPRHPSNGTAQFRCNNGTWGPTPEPGATCTNLPVSMCGAGQCDTADIGDSCGNCIDSGQWYTTAGPGCWKWRCNSGTWGNQVSGAPCPIMCTKF